MLIFRKFQIKNFDINNKMHTIYNLKRIKQNGFFIFKISCQLSLLTKGWSCMVGGCYMMHIFFSSLTILQHAHKQGSVLFSLDVFFWQQRPQGMKWPDIAMV